MIRIFALFFMLLFVKSFAEDSIEDLFNSSPEQIVTLAEASDFLIGGIIHPLSGQPCLRQTDFVVKGAQSIPLKRTFIPYYTPLNEHKGKIHPSEHSFGGWVHFPHAHLNVFRKGKDNHGRFILKETLVSVADPQGAVLVYQVHKNGNITLKAKPFGICNGVSDHPSGIYDPRNVSITVGNLDVTLKAPDGTKRHYHSSCTYDLNIGKKNYNCLYCVLTKEILPNGKVLRYSYNNERQVKKVESLDPSESIVYASITIEAPLKETQAVCKSNTGLQATYEHHTGPYFKKDKHEHYLDLLYPLHFTKASTPYFRDEKIQNIKNPYGDSLLLGYQGRQSIFQLIYQFEIFKRVKDKKALPIKELHLPSETGKFSAVYSMDYVRGVPGETNSITTVSHCDGIKTIYTFNLQMLPEKVSEYDQKGSLIKEKMFTWYPNQWLKSIVITDGKQQWISEKKFQYDTFGNPISETLTGDLTGSCQPASDEIKRTFSTDCRNLLLKEEHSNGKVLCYTYLPETNLLTSCLIRENGVRCLCREFRHYDRYNNLIEVITDDGSGDLVDDLTDVTERKITRYHLRQEPPFLHLPENIEEKYWEHGIEKLLKKTMLVYDNWGNVAEERVYDSEGIFAYTIQKKYDEQGNILFETNPLGQHIPYTYYPNGKEKTSWNFSNTMVTLSDYDAKGRLAKKHEITTEEQSRIFLYGYDPKDRLTRRTDSYNHSTIYTYDLVANQPAEINRPTIYHSDGQALAVTEKTSYDALGRKSLSIDPNGNQTLFLYNTYGSPTVIIYPDQSQETFRYRPNGLLFTHTLKNGLVIEYDHDVLGNVKLKAYFFNPDSAIQDAKAMQDFELESLLMGADHSQKVKSAPIKSDYGSKDCVALASSIAESGFNGKRLGQEQFIYKGSKLLKSYDLEGNLTEYTYDGLGRKISEEKDKCRTTFQYDSLGSLGTICEENGENSLYIHFKRDLLGQVLEKKKTDAHGNLLTKIVYSYDGNGNIKIIERKINGQEAIETFTYDAYNRETLHKDAQGYKTTTRYDEKALNPFGQQVLRKTTQNPKLISTIETFDPYGRMTKQETLNASSEVISAKDIEYDACGNQVLHQDHVYQGDHYLTTRTVKWTYDPCHRIKSMIRGFNTSDARTTSWTYHPSGKVFTKTQPDGLVLSYNYDALNHPKSIKSSDGKLSHSFAYNLLGHLQKASDDLKNLKITRKVDPHGNIRLEEFSNGLQIKKTYDHRHRLLTMSLPDGGEVVYHYDPLFLRKVERLAASGSTLYEHTYESYDESGYLLTEQLPAGLGVILHATDTKGQAISISSDHFKQECEYDPIGNMTSQTIDGTYSTFDYDDLSQLIAEPNCNYGYDSLYNRTHENGNQVQYNVLNEPLSNQTASFIYDLRGNLTKKSDSSQILILRYDPLDRLIEAEIDDKKISYCYDPLGRKISKTVTVDSDEIKEDFIYDGRNEIGSISEDGRSRQLRILGLGSHPEQRNIVAIELGGKAYAPLLDIQGNVRSLVDIATKAPAASYNYTAFGKPFPSPNRVFNPWQYASKRFDPDLGLIDFGKRHYDPQLGRWLSTDPAGFIDSHNLYQFNFNNPFRYCDPNGEFIFGFIPLLAGAFGVTAAGAAAITFEVATVNILVSAVAAGAVIYAMEQGLSDIEQKVNQTPKPNENPDDEKKKKPKPTRGIDEDELKKIWEDQPQPPFSGRELGNDPSRCPGEGFEWRGNGPPSNGKGNWVRGDGPGRETLHPDFNHPEPIEPHWDYKGPNFPNGARLYRDGSWEFKNAR